MGGVRTLSMVGGGGGGGCGLLSGRAEGVEGLWLGVAREGRAVAQPKYLQALREDSAGMASEDMAWGRQMSTRGCTSESDTSCGGCDLHGHALSHGRLCQAWLHGRHLPGQCQYLLYQESRNWYFLREEESCTTEARSSLSFFKPAFFVDRAKHAYIDTNFRR